MLLVRERRVQRQQELLQEFGRPLVCFTMNIPGPVKLSALICRSFRLGLAQLEGALPNILHREVREEVTGCEAFLAVDADALDIKQICTRIEDETPVGRLFDMDVLDTDGTKLDRILVKGGDRGCIVCGAPGRGCASRRLHSLEQLHRATREIQEGQFRELDSCTIGDLAVESLLEEVHTTPKPGLVDEANTGSHGDMDRPLFEASAKALRPYFRQCVRIGQEGKGHRETFDALRRAGREAEETMFRATGGINTHKGAIFTLGILCGALGMLWTPEEPIPALSDLRKTCADLARFALEQDFAALSSGTTAGERLYLERGITGIRGEAAAGLPSAADIGLPAFREAMNRGLSPNDAGAVTLLHLIARVEDTNLHHRGGPDGAAWAKEAAAKLLPWPAMVEISQLDEDFIQRNLSPGGCADLLAVVYFLYKLEKAAV